MGRRLGCGAGRAGSRAGRGRWRLEQYQTQDARKLSPETRGFRLVHGRVSEIRQSRHNVWVDIDGPLQMQVSNLDYNSYVGAIAVGRVTRGSIRPNQQVMVVKYDGEQHKAKV